MITKGSRKVADDYGDLATSLHATVLPKDAIRALLSVLDEQRPIVRAESIDGDSATLDLVWGNGMAGELAFVRKRGRWRLDLARELEDAVRILEGFERKFTLFRRAAEGGKPVYLEGDDS